MRTALVGLALLAALVTGPARGEGDPSPEPVGASVHRQEEFTLFEAILPGELLDWGVASTAMSPRRLVLLIELDDESRQLMQWSLEGAGDLVELGPPLPEEAQSLISYGGEVAGASGTLVAADGTLLGLVADQSWSSLYESPLDLFALRTVRGGRYVSGDRLIVRSVGLLQALGHAPEAGSLQPIWQYELPLRVDREWGGLRLDTPPVAAIDWDSESPSRLVLGPESHGKRRVRTVLLEPTDDGELDTLETWSMLPTPEDIEESWYVEFQSEPALIVTTVLAEKHGVFEKKKLRLFRLQSDRTRAGSGPILETLTKTRNWYGTCAGVADVNGDGLDDLVSAQPKGLGAGSLWVEAYLARPGWGFDAKPRGSEIKVEEGERCTLAIDIDGDQRVELAVVEDDTLLVFPLLLGAKLKTVVDDSARWRVELDSIESRPHPIDLFPSSASQILLTGHTEGKRQAVRVVRFH